MEKEKYFGKVTSDKNKQNICKCKEPDFMPHPGYFGKYCMKCGLDIKYKYIKNNDK